MADFPTALDEALHDRYNPRSDFRTPITQGRGFKARVAALERRYGTQKAAAEAVGINPNTWSKWKRGVQAPGRASLAKIEGTHRSLLRAGSVKRQGMPTGFSIRAIVAGVPVGGAGRPKKERYYNGGNSSSTNAHRTFRADRLTASHAADVVTAWAAGKSRHDVAEVLLRAIEREYPSRFEFEGNDVTVTIT